MPFLCSFFVYNKLIAYVSTIGCITRRRK
jgi:hypothetical protein